MTRFVTRTLAGAALAVALVAAPAQAGELIEVDGNHITHVEDPAVPSGADADLGLPSRPAPVVARSSSARGKRAVYRALARELGRRRITSGQYRRWRRTYVLSARALRALSGARDSQLRYVLGSVESLALTGRLTATRMPAAFLNLERNRQYWRKLPFPGARDQVSFRGSPIVYTYFPGYGLQIHPLSTFKRANAIHGFCERGEPGCDRAALRDVLDEMTGLAVQRSRRFIAWEYLFYWQGGSPPWMSGMAQATAIQAYARAAKLLGVPSYVATARKALGAFETPPPLGVRTTGPGGGVHYLQYSFAPRFYIFNAFLQSLIGLHDFSVLAHSPRALRLYRDAEPEARREVPFSDVGDWSRYSYGGAEATADYHELMREFLQSMCTRHLGALYCDYAKRYRGYQVDPPVLKLEGPADGRADEPLQIRFNVSKLSAVEVKVRKAGKVVFTRLATFRRGNGSFAWTPHSGGTFRVQLAAKELRTGLGKRDRISGTIEVAP